MIKVGFKVVRALDCGIYEAGTVTPERLEKCARIAAVFGARPLVTGVECAESAVRPEVRAFPEIDQPEHALLDAPFSGFTIAFEQVQFLEPLEYPEGEIDLDAVRIEDPAVEFVGQSFANEKLVDFGAPARSLGGCLWAAARSLLGSTRHYELTVNALTSASQEA